MQRLARVAIGTVQPGADGTFVAWALMAALERVGLRVQSFAARACFSPRDGASTITGQATRHLDTWLFEPEACRLLFERGATNCDFALIEGRFDSALSKVEQVGGKLATLCDWLDLPSIAVVDACRLRDCQLPNRPPRIDGILIDGARCSSEQCRLQTWLEALWGVPVLGFVEDAPRLRAEVSALPLGTPPPRALCAAIGARAFAPSVLGRILSLAAHRDAWQQAAPAMSAILPQRRLRVATAFDDAFHCYFPDALDQLELLGAEIIDFSPLRDDRLPLDTDLVYFGCGRPDLHAHQLTENCCLIAELRRHVEGGGRLYAECGGLAYLAQHIDLPDGQRLKMSGVLPITASIESELCQPMAVELSLASDCWLGEVGSLLRGYRTGRWNIEPADESVRNIIEHDADENDLLVYHNAIGSRVHLNFAMQPLLLDRMFEPHLVGQAF
jgi:cobyrinic acid a,c-diamide synthase